MIRHSQFRCGLILALSIMTLVLVFVFDSAAVAQELDQSGAKAGQQYAAAREHAATGGSVASTSDAAVAAQPPSGYRVGAADELMISVWHEPELSQAVTVRRDGMITLPLLNDVKVAGLTTGEMQRLLTEKLNTLVNDPQVTVIVKAVHSQKVFVAGNVAKQGVYALDGRKTVLELLVEAGGPALFAKTGSIYILRNDNGKEIRIPFNYKKALSAKGPNPELLPGDMVVVP